MAKVFPFQPSAPVRTRFHAASRPAAPAQVEKHSEKHFYWPVSVARTVTDSVTEPGGLLRPPWAAEVTAFPPRAAPARSWVPLGEDAVTPEPSLLHRGDEL